MGGRLSRSPSLGRRTAPVGVVNLYPARRAIRTLRPNVRVMARVGACILGQVREGTAGGRDGGRRRAVLSLQPCVASESLHFP